VASKSAAQRWGEDCERTWYHDLTHPPVSAAQPKEAPTVAEFWPRFLEGHARANRQKPSGIAAKEMIARVHLMPALGDPKLDAIRTEDVQRLKCQLGTKAAKSVNNILVVLSVMLKKAVEWD
jgi:Phage integrase, N-terminal SAM-like domain